MQALLTIVVVVQLLTALVMIGLVLIQHGKGADMGASFGSGSSGSLFGATGSANFLSRSTGVCAAVFFACTLALAYFGNLRGGIDSGSVLERAVPAAPVASTPSSMIPGVAPSDVASSAVPMPAPSAASAAPAAAASGAAQIPTR